MTSGLHEIRKVLHEIDKLVMDFCCCRADRGYRSAGKRLVIVGETKEPPD
jgi:hypothetical protein